MDFHPDLSAFHQQDCEQTEFIRTTFPAQEFQELQSSELNIRGPQGGAIFTGNEHDQRGSHSVTPYNWEAANACGNQVQPYQLSNLAASGYAQDPNTHQNGWDTWNTSDPFSLPTANDEVDLGQGSFQIGFTEVGRESLSDNKHSADNPSQAGLGTCMIEKAVDDSQGTADLDIDHQFSHYNTTSNENENNGMTFENHTGDDWTLTHSYSTANDGESSGHSEVGEDLTPYFLYPQHPSLSCEQPSEQPLNAITQGQFVSQVPPDGAFNQVPYASYPATSSTMDISSVLQDSNDQTLGQQAVPTSGEVVERVPMINPEPIIHSDWEIAEAYYAGEGDDPIEERERQNKKFKPLTVFAVPTKNKIISIRQADMFRARVPNIPFMPSIARTSIQVFFSFLYLLTQKDWDAWDEQFSGTGDGKLQFFMKILPRIAYPSRVRYLTSKKIFMEKLQEIMLSIAKEHWVSNYTDIYQEPDSYDDFDENHPEFPDVTVPFKDWAKREDAELIIFSALVLQKREWDAKYEAKLLEKDPSSKIPQSSGKCRNLLKRTANYDSLMEEIRKYQKEVDELVRKSEADEKAKLKSTGYEMLNVADEDMTVEDFIHTYSYAMPVDKEKRAIAREAARAAALEAAQNAMKEEELIDDEESDRDMASPPPSASRSSRTKAIPKKSSSLPAHISCSAYPKPKGVGALKREADAKKLATSADGKHKKSAAKNAKAEPAKKATVATKKNFPKPDKNRYKIAIEKFNANFGVGKAERESMVKAAVETMRMYHEHHVDVEESIQPGKHYYESEYEQSVQDAEHNTAGHVYQKERGSDYCPGNLADHQFTLQNNDQNYHGHDNNQQRFHEDQNNNKQANMNSRPDLEGTHFNDAMTYSGTNDTYHPQTLNEHQINSTTNSLQGYSLPAFGNGNTNERQNNVNHYGRHSQTPHMNQKWNRKKNSFSPGVLQSQQPWQVSPNSAIFEDRNQLSEANLPNYQNMHYRNPAAQQRYDALPQNGTLNFNQQSQLHQSGHNYQQQYNYLPQPEAFPLAPAPYLQHQTQPTASVTDFTPKKRLVLKITSDELKTPQNFLMSKPTSSGLSSGTHTKPRPMSTRRRGASSSMNSGGNFGKKSLFQSYMEGDVDIKNVTVKDDDSRDGDYVVGGRGKKTKRANAGRGARGKKK